MTQILETEEMQFIRWFFPVNYKNLKFLKAEHITAKLLFEKLKREEETMDDKEELLLKEILESLIKQLSLATNELQRAEDLEIRFHDNQERLANIVNVFKRDIVAEVKDSRNYAKGLVQENERKINSLDGDHKALLTLVTGLSGKVGQFETRMDTLFRLGGIIGAVVGLAIAALALIK